MILVRSSSRFENRVALVEFDGIYSRVQVGFGYLVGRANVLHAREVEPEEGGGKCGSVDRRARSCVCKRPWVLKLDDATDVMFWTCGLHGCDLLVKIQ